MCVCRGIGKMRGGKREGAGRPLTAGEPRKQRQIRATDNEWNLIHEFSVIVKKDIKKAKEILATVKTK